MSVVCSVGLLVSQSVGRLVCRSASQSNYWSAGRSDDWSARQPAGRTTGQPAGRTIFFSIYLLKYITWNLALVFNLPLVLATSFPLYQYLTLDQLMYMVMGEVNMASSELKCPHGKVKYSILFIPKTNKYVDIFYEIYIKHPARGLKTFIPCLKNDEYENILKINTMVGKIQTGFIHLTPDVRDIDYIKIIASGVKAGGKLI